MLRRSHRIASTYGPVYSNLPSVASIRRQKKIKDIWSLAKEMKAALRRDEEIQRKNTNPIAFELGHSVEFLSIWGTLHYVKNPVPGITYDQVRVKIVYETHTGPCSDPESWSIEKEEMVDLYFKPFTKTEQKKPLNKSWKTCQPNHSECGINRVYTVEHITRITIPLLENRCTICHKEVETMQYCLCQMNSVIDEIMSEQSMASEQSVASEQSTTSFPTLPEKDADEFEVI